MIQGSAHIRETMPSAKKPASAMGKKQKRNWYELNNTGEITSLHGLGLVLIFQTRPRPASAQRTPQHSVLELDIPFP